MKRLSLIVLLCVLFCLPCKADLPVNTSRVVFVYHIPDDETPQDNQIPDVKEDIVSDDITADTSARENAEVADDEYFDDEDEYLVSGLYSDVLKGYASYDEEDEEDGVTLEPDFNTLTLNIKKPVSIKSKNYPALKNIDIVNDSIYTKFNGTEYNIAPVSSNHSTYFGGGLSSGTLYEQEISYGELEQSSGVFSKYEYKRFALTTSYTKTVNTTNNNYNDNFAIVPELQLCQYLTLKQKLSADTVKKRKKAEITLSINPFGKRDKDRLRFNLSASETYDEVSNTFWNRFEFNTIFKL